MSRTLLLVLLGCGGGGGSSGPDAAPDVPAVKVVALSSCPATVDASMVDSASAFIPKTVTLPVGGILKITTTADHFVIPHPSTGDPALMVSRNQTKCFRFDVTGTYGIVCGAHGFAATITVP